MEQGRRLENMSWRIWNRETFCCESQPQFASASAINFRPRRPESKDVPELSASVDSVSSDDFDRTQTGPTNSSPVDIQARAPPPSSPPSYTSSRAKVKHLTSLGLEKMVISIKETKKLEALSPSIADAVPSSSPPLHPIPSPTTSVQRGPRPIPDPLTSTAPLASSAGTLATERRMGSRVSTELRTSHSVVRGFSPNQVSSSLRSTTHPAPSSLSGQYEHRKMDDGKKHNLFLLGGSSSEDDNSYKEEASCHPPPQSSLTAGLKKPVDRKQTSFKDEVESRTINHKSSAAENVFESDDEDDVSESAIEDEEDESEWEDSATDSGNSSVHNELPFHKVDSRPNLVSRRSLLTTMIHQPERAAALAEQAARSHTNLHKSRVSPPTGPSVAASPADDSILNTREAARPRSKSKPIIMTTSNIHPPALSPRTTRRNMLATELTESLRKHLLWERQQKSTTANAVLKRRHTAQVDLAKLQRYPSVSGSGATSKNNSWNDGFSGHGAGEYHQRGW